MTESAKDAVSMVLADLTSWRVGGVVDRFYQPVDIASLSQFLSGLPKNEPITWLGLGSNVLIRDGGIRGTVIHTQAHLRGMGLLSEGLIRAEAGVSCAQLARFTARNALAGLEFLAGIPGSVGGALAMNAGCHGGETWDAVVCVETIDHEGNCHIRDKTFFDIAYRSVKSPLNEWFVAGHFRVPAGEKTVSLDKIRALLDQRAATQPINEPNCGSVFRNPPHDFAARLIQTAGLKGYRIGDAQVSEKHANFIVNIGHATAKQIEELIQFVHDQVLIAHQVDLVREVHILGEPLFI